MPTRVPAIDRAMRILNAYKNGQLEFGVSELSQALDINKSTVHGIVQTLSEYRMLEQDPGSRKYRLGPGLIELGGLAQTRRDVRRVARPLLIELMRRTNETVLLGVFEQDGITLIDVVEPARQLRIAVAAGQRLPYSAGSFGRAFLAWMDEEEIDRQINAQGLREYTKSSITDPAQYKSNLRKVRKQGYAVDDSEEYLEGIWAVSTPIHGAEGIQAVVTVVGFSSRLSKEDKRAAIKLANQTAQQISTGMGIPATEAG
jgi:IclR family KDG regulon transcriptional repressor